MGKSLRRLLIFLKSNYFPFLFLTIGFIHGIIYVFLMPPWQHYDEPGQFEYTWMIANSSSIPKTGMYDNSIRLKILQSMKEHRFFDTPGLIALEKYADTLDPVWIGVTQVGDPPLYYWLTALPVRLLQSQPVEIQLISTRLVSLALWLAVLFVSWRFAIEITPEQHPLRWMLPISTALLPAFVEHSTALNNDIAATFVYSLVILFGTRLMKNGFRISNVLILLCLLILSYFTKASIWLSIFVIPLAFFFTLMRTRNILWTAGLLVSFGLVASFVLFEFNDAAYWFRDTTQAQPTRGETDFGLAIQIVPDSSGRSNALLQAVSTVDPKSLAGQTVTVGAWMWGKGNQSVFPPSILVINPRYEREYLRPEAVQLNPTPSFYSFTYQIPKEFVRIYFVLEPFIDIQGTEIVHFKDPVLVRGDTSGNQIPTFYSRNQNGDWNGQPFDNLVRNSDSLEIWPIFRSNIITLMNTVDYRISQAANWIIYSLDVKGTFWYTRESAANIFRSFWGKFGWGHIRLAGGKPYVLPLIFSLVGLIPGVYGLIKNIPKFKFFILSWFGFAIAAILFYAWFTGISMQAYFSRPIFPDARYVFPTVIIGMGFIVAGWEMIISHIPSKFRKYAYFLYFAYFGYMILLSYYSIRSFYGIYQ